MFGYVKPFKPELKMREFDAYKAVYCGLCEQLGKSYGPLARLTLSYDFTFLCMIAASAIGEPPDFQEKRCCVNPLKKTLMCVSPKARELGADIAAIMIYHKLLDNIRDSGFIKSLMWRTLLPLASRTGKKAAKSRPEADRIISYQMERQREIESRRSAVTDEACEPSAVIMEGIFSLLSEDEAERRVLGRIGYLLGRYVYLCDALDDLDGDIKTGSYNPLALKLSEEGEKSRADVIGSARASLMLTVGELEKTGDLLDAKYYGPIIMNITRMGLRAGVEEITSRKTKALSGA